MSVELVTSPIEYQDMVEAARLKSAGAVVLFLGTVRDLSDGKSVSGLDYEAFPSLALSKLQEILDAARTKWPILHAAVTHRHGHLDLGEIAVAVVVSSAHRMPAFSAGEWIMDSIKQSVPIWKRENWVDGDQTWVHQSGKPQ